MGGMGVSCLKETSPLAMVYQRLNPNKYTMKYPIIIIIILVIIIIRVSTPLCKT
jgi:hypothetical protein